MDVLLTVLAWIGIVLGALLALVLLIPLHGRAEGEVGEESLWGQVTARWGFGVLALKLRSDGPSGLYLLGVRVSGLDWNKRRKEKKKPKEKKEPGEKKGLAWFLEHRRTLTRSLVRLLRALDPRIRIRGVVGLGDPADTVAAAQIIEAVAARVPRVDLALEWEHLDEVLELSGSFRARVWPVQLVGVVLALLLSRDVRRMLGWGRKRKRGQQQEQHAGVT